MRNNGAAALLAGVVFAAALEAQLPRPFYQWWNSPVANNINLTPEQRREIRTTVRDYHPHLLSLRAQIEQAELDLEKQFDQDPVDTRKAHDAIGRLSAARSDLTRTLSEMSLKLRTVLTQQQWQELQKRRPVKGQAEP